MDSRTTHSAINPSGGSRMVTFDQGYDAIMSNPGFRLPPEGLVRIKKGKKALRTHSHSVA
jgi:hypothetical protein